MLLIALTAITVGATPPTHDSFPKFKLGTIEQKLKPTTSSRRMMPDSPNEAAAYWYGSRVSENGQWPHDAAMRAKEQLDRLRELDGGGVSAASWTWLGPGNVGGRLRAILIHPTNPSTMWVGSVGGGIWRRSPPFRENCGAGRRSRWSVGAWRYDAGKGIPLHANGAGDQAS